MSVGAIRSLLVVAPHPDDEVIGCGGLIARTLEAGGRVAVCIMSDGAASHPGSPTFPPDRLARTRRAESLAALGHLGVGADSVHFLDLPDGESQRWPAPAELDALLALPWDAVALPSAFDNHADHRVTQAMVSRRAVGARQLHYLVWPHESGLRPPTPCLSVELGAHRRAKAESLLHYATQLGMIRDAEWNFAIDQPLFQRFCAPVEHFHA